VWVLEFGHLGKLGPQPPREITIFIWYADFFDQMSGASGGVFGPEQDISVALADIRDAFQFHGLASASKRDETPAGCRHPLIIAGKLGHVLNCSGRQSVSGGARGRRRLRNSGDAVAYLQPHSSKAIAEFF
jgi:hypothetical protein